jgi:hypothetical protein
VGAVRVEGRDHAWSPRCRLEASRSSSIASLWTPGSPLPSQIASRPARPVSEAHLAVVYPRASNRVRIASSPLRLFASSPLRTIACFTGRLTFASSAWKLNATLAYILLIAVRLPVSIMRYQWNAVPRTGLAMLLSMRNLDSPLSPSSLNVSLRRCDRVRVVWDHEAESNRRACTSCKRYSRSS